ncbi:MAG: ABC transporter permease [Desulfobacteraceae bacterium]|nr:ABC transporter permease [Desulfobacteraceae bacterium]
MKKTISNGFSLVKLFQPQFGLIWLLFAMVLVFSITSNAFRTPENLLEILRSSGIYAILVLGLTWVVATGELDVSFASVAALVSMVTAYLIKIGLPIGVIVILALAAGTLVGIINGLMVSYLKIPSLIATIATGFTATAIAKVMGEGKPIFIAVQSKIVYEFVYGKIFGIPILFLAALLIYLACRFLQDRTIMGQHLYALGENRQATQEAGINASKIVFYYFILSSVMSAIAGILVTAQFGSGQHEIGGGNAVMIEGFTAVFLGAMVIKAGKPNVIGTLIGVIILTVLVNWITLLGLPTFIVWLTRGTLLLVGVTIVTLSGYQRRVMGKLQIG